MGFFDFVQVERTSPLNQGMSSKSASKKANNPQKQEITNKKSFMITTATGAIPSPERESPENYAADFYRNGKYYEDFKTLETYPRAFEPIDESITASIRIWGKPKNADVYSNLLPAYTKFFLEAVQESHAERSQIIETFGDFYVFMFGERPPIYNFSGQLINSKNANWVADFMFMYDRFYRGTKCVEQNATVTIVYGGRQAEGLLLSVGTTTNATIDGAVGFNLSMVVFDRKSYSFSEDLGYTSFTSVTGIGRELRKDDEFLSILEQIAPPTGKGSSDEGISDAIKEANHILNSADPSQGAV